jgi:CRP-like cAMP-binding protein
MISAVISASGEDRRVSDILLELVPDLPAECVPSLADASEPRVYQPGELIVGEGAPSAGIFLLVSGTVQPAVSNRNSGVTLNLQRISALAVLGLADAMLAQRSVVSVRAVTATDVAFIGLPDFLRTLARSPQAGLAFSQVIASELARTYSQLSRLRSGVGVGHPSAM